jgi:hypothetical protein
MHVRFLIRKACSHHAETFTVTFWIWKSGNGPACECHMLLERGWT